MLILKHARQAETAHEEMKIHKKGLCENARPGHTRPHQARDQHFLMYGVNLTLIVYTPFYN